MGSQVWHESPEEGRRVCRSKCCEYNIKNEDKNPNTVSDENYQPSYQKFRQIQSGLFHGKRLGNRVHCTFIFTFLCCCLLRVCFFCRLFYWIWIIYKQIYLIHRWEPNRYHHSALRMDLGVILMKRYFTLLRSLGIEPQHQMQFCVQSSTYLFGEEGRKEGLTPPTHTHTHFSGDTVIIF